MDVIRMRLLTLTSKANNKFPIYVYLFISIHSEVILWDLNPQPIGFSFVEPLQTKQIPILLLVSHAMFWICKKMCKLDSACKNRGYMSTSLLYLFCAPINTQFKTFLPKRAKRSVESKPKESFSIHDVV